MHYGPGVIGRYLTCAQVGDYLALTEQTVRELIRKGSIPAVKVGRNVRISEVELEKYLSAHQAGR